MANLAKWLIHKNLNPDFFGSKGAYFEALIKHQVLEMLRGSDWNNRIGPDYREP